MMDRKSCLYRLDSLNCFALSRRFSSSSSLNSFLLEKRNSFETNSAAPISRASSSISSVAFPVITTTGMLLITVSVMIDSSSSIPESCGIWISRRTRLMEFSAAISIPSWALLANIKLKSLPSIAFSITWVDFSSSITKIVCFSMKNLVLYL